MLNQKLKARNEERLAGIHPKMASAVRALLDDMDRYGHPMIVTDGVRTAAQQRALFEQGRSMPGKIVTYRDGVTIKSNHQPWADGFGHAVDCTFVVDLDADGDVDDPTWDERRPWDLYALVAKSKGLAAGFYWTKPDKPHVEWL